MQRSKPRNAHVRTLGPEAAKPAFLQVGFDSAGRHKYVALGEAADALGRPGAAGPLRVWTEAELEDGPGLDAVLVLYRAVGVAAGPSRADQPDHELCPPMALGRNYSIVEELTLGRTRRMFLCDEHTLKTGVAQNGIGLLNHLSMIVNCHQAYTADAPGKYDVGAATSTCERVYQPVHIWLHGPDSPAVMAAMDHLQAKIWQGAQRGAVAVHCLAGIHRAPTVLCCHWLYRHYALGQTHLTADVDQIYARMRAVRPAVTPLSYIKITRAYEAYLQEKHTAPISGVAGGAR